MIIIKSIQELNNQPNDLFLNYNNSFYGIIFKYNEYMLLQLYLTNNNNFQWIFIGKPFIKQKYYKNVKSACADILTQSNGKIIIAKNKTYTDLIKILTILNNAQIISDIV